MRALAAGFVGLIIVALGTVFAHPQASAVNQQLDRYRPGVTTVAPLPRATLVSGAMEFRRDAAAWIAAGAADQPRRRLVVATYVLDMLKDVEETALWEDGRSATGLLEWACATIRDAAPLPVERAWHVAAIALIERSSVPPVLAKHLDHAEARVPNDDKWLLARALVDEWETRQNPHDDGTLSVSGGKVARALQHFEQAAAKESIRQEAQLRWSAYESDLGRQDAALGRLDRVGDLKDPFLLYWFGLIKGRALQRANRHDDAIEAYRKAVATVPSAQSGALGLAAALVSARRMSEAAAIVNRVVTPEAAGAAPDPWGIYPSPDVRFWPGALDDLRKAVAP